MLTSKQRASLRAMANGLDTIFQVGKEGLSESFFSQVHGALESRELIKLRVLDNSMMDPRETAGLIAGRCGAEVVQVIGSRFVLYRPAKEKKITL